MLGGKAPGSVVWPPWRVGFEALVPVTPMGSSVMKMAATEP